MAKILVLLGFIVVAGAITTGINVNPYTVTINVSSTYNCSGYPQACYDCQTIAYCQTLPNNTVQYLMADTCGGSTPYCNSTTRTCQSTITQNCLQAMNCTSFGTNFPMPNQCNTYLQCFANGTQTIATCSNSSLPYYSASSGTCQRSASSCAVSCPSVSQQSVGFSSDNRYYAACMNGQPRLVYKCRPPTYFASTLGYCSMSCNGQATNNSNPNDCHSYLSCGSTPNSVAVVKSCPDGQVFDLGTYACTNSSLALFTVQPCVP